MKESMPFVLAEDEDTYQYSPERGLLAAILERSFRDLGESSSIEDRREAIKWFTQVLPENKYRLEFTYQQVLEVLCLSGAQISFIAERVKHAESINDRQIAERRYEVEGCYRPNGQTERENTRVRVGKLSKRKKHYFGQAYIAV